MNEVTFARQFLTLLDARPIKLPSDYVADPRKLPAQSAVSSHHSTSNLLPTSVSKLLTTHQTILPRNTHPFPRPSSKTTTTSSNSSATTTTSTTGTTTNPSPPAPTTIITLTPLRPTPSLPQPLVLPAQNLRTTSLYDVKSLAAKATGYTPDKLKLLWRKKPVGDAKTISEILEGGAGGGGEVELQVMFIGGPTLAPLSLEGDDDGGKGAKEEDVQMLDSVEEVTGQQGGENREVESKLSSAEIEASAVPGDPAFWKDLRAWVDQRFQGDKRKADEVLEVFWRAWEGRVRR